MLFLNTEKANGLGTVKKKIDSSKTILLKKKKESFRSEAKEKSLTRGGKADFFTAKYNPKRKYSNTHYNAQGNTCDDTGFRLLPNSCSHIKEVLHVQKQTSKTPRSTA